MQGKERVGTAVELPLARRVQLAVVAHIRHVYTDYDKLLKKGDYLLARSKVEQGTLDKLLTWRRDDDDDPNAMEGILREVIVIPDDDEDDASYNLNAIDGVHSDREDSIEIVSDRGTPDVVQIRPIEYSKMNDRANPDPAYSPDMDTTGAVRYIQKNHPLHHQVGHYGLEKVDRMGVYRNRIWEEALHRRRKEPGPFYPMENSLVVPGVARPNHGLLVEDHAGYRSQRPENKAHQSHLIEYVGKAPARHEPSQKTMPLFNNRVEGRYDTNYNGEPSRDNYSVQGPVSEVYFLI